MSKALDFLQADKTELQIMDFADGNLKGKDKDKIQKLILDSEDGLWRPQPGVLKKFHATGEAIPETLRARLRARALETVEGYALRAASASLPCGRDVLKARPAEGFSAEENRGIAPPPWIGAPLRHGPRGARRRPRANRARRRRHLLLSKRGPAL